MIRKSLILILFIILSIIFVFTALAFGGQQSSVYLVTKVVDGDTIKIKIKNFIGIATRYEMIRLTGIDAPELGQGQIGMLSKKHLKKIISQSNWAVRLEFDTVQRDKYNRLLCYVWSIHGWMINEKMVLDGYALAYTIPPNVLYSYRFVKAQETARSNNLGLWAKNGFQKKPFQWRLENPRLKN